MTVSATESSRRWLWAALLITAGKLWLTRGQMVYAIGNAPTALFEVVHLIESGRMAPAMVVGVPVGFVSAVESKLALIAGGYPHIAARGRKGGTPVAVSILNALLSLAKLKS